MKEIYKISIPAKYYGVVSHEVQRINGAVFESGEIKSFPDVAYITCSHRQCCYSIPWEWMKKPSDFLEFEEWIKQDPSVSSSPMETEYNIARHAWKHAQSNLMLKLKHEGKLKQGNN